MHLSNQDLRQMKQHFEDVIDGIELNHIYMSGKGLKEVDSLMLKVKRGFRCLEFM